MRVAVAKLLQRRSGASTEKGQSAGPLLRADSVAGSPATVARRLRSDGFDARAVDGRVIVRGATAAEVRKALETLDTGPVRVVVRP